MSRSALAVVSVADLNVLKKSEHVAQWIRLSKGEHAKAQVAPSGHTGGHPDQGINAAVRELGVERAAAARRLGWTEIEAKVSEGDDRELRMWEISENLHRAELNAMERAQHVSEWIRLKAGEDQSAQLAPIESKRPDGRGHRQQGGTNAAVRELGIERTEAQRSVKIDSLPPEVKKVARELGYDDTALISIPALAGDKENPARAAGQVR